jgi:hypothetical protein
MGIGAVVGGGVLLGTAVVVRVGVGGEVSPSTKVGIGGKALGVSICDGSTPSDAQAVTITTRIMPKARLLDLII